MQKLFSISLSFLFLLGSFFPKMDVEEVYKIPQVFVHYQNEHAELDFISFLIFHYGFDDSSDNRKHQKEHQKEHEKLPLNSDHHAHLLSFTCCMLGFFSIQKVEQVFEVRIFSVFLNHYSFLGEDELLYPPQKSLSV